MNVAYIETMEWNGVMVAANWLQGFRACRFFSASVSCAMIGIPKKFLAGQLNRKWNRFFLFELDITDPSTLVST